MFCVCLCIFSDDAAEFEVTLNCMRDIGVTSDDQQQLFRLLAGMLHLGTRASNRALVQWLLCR